MPHVILSFLLKRLHVTHPPTWRDILHITSDRQGQPTKEFYYHIRVDFLTSIFVADFYLARPAKLPGHFDWFFSEEK